MTDIEKVKRHFNHIFLVHAAWLFLFIFFSSFLLQQSNNILYWSKDRKLTWDDFTEKNIEDAALTNSGVELDKHYQHRRGSSKIDSMKIKIVAVFYKTTSFVSPGFKTEPLLNHEQVHFDITEKYARKFRKIIKEDLPNFNDFRLEIFIDSVYNKIGINSKKEQVLYDVETNHHENKQEQHRWNMMIAKSLKELEQYSDSSTIRIVWNPNK